jgi:hypothetical protein
VRTTRPRPRAVGPVVVLFINDDQADQQAGTRELVRAFGE